MRVLLVSANTEKINMPVLPLGLACVATATRKSGHKTKVLNLMDQQDSKRVLKEAIEELRPELIGMSVRNKVLLLSRILTGLERQMAAL
jgi:hypothetical protein